MADKKISALTSLAQGDVAVSTDVLPIVDTSATETKKVTAAALVGAGLTAGVTSVDINSGAIDGTTIGASSAAAGTFTNLTASGTVSFSGATVSNGGSVTTVDINGGTIDGATIATSDITVGSGKTLNVSAGTLTLADNQISGDKVEGGTINAITINTLTSTAVNATTVDATNVEVTNVKAKDGTASIAIADSTGIVTVTAAPVVSALTASQAVFTTSGKALVSNAITGSGNVVMSASPTLTGTIDAAAQTLSGNLTLNGGTANGVLYLNGSKVATSGSALSFDGTLLKVGNPTNAPNTNLSGNLLQVKSSSGFSYLTMGNGDGANNNTYIGSASSIATFGTVTDAGVTTELMRLTSTGLGIGTSSPGYKLDVSGQAKTTNGFIVNNGTNAGFFTTDGTNVNFGSSTSGKGLALFVGASSQAALFDSSGNLGLGVSPSAWSTLVPAFQLGGGGTFLSARSTSPELYLGTNAHFNGTNYIYKTTNVASLYAQDTGIHKWFNAASGTAGNTITFTQALTLNTNGALVLQGGDTNASGVGVAFPATQSASSNANTLDDYEEGTFTPTAVCTGQTITYTERSGAYTKIGNIVRFQIGMIINTVSGAAGGNTTISGLPFTNGNATYSGQFAIGYNDGFANTIYGGWISGTELLFRNGTRGSGNDGGGFTAGGYIYIAGVYAV